MNHKTYPKGYRQIEVIDFMRSRRQMKILAVSGVIVTAAMIVYGLIAHPFAPTWEMLKKCWWAWLVTPAMYVLYIPLHELTHGLLMHALSGVKPKYGLRLPYAYAGSYVYFDKKSHNLIALAPLVLWGAVLFALERLLPAAWFWPFYIIQISNVSGSVGDAYCVFHLRKLPEDVVIQDTGTRMRIFAPRPTGEEQQ